VSLYSPARKRISPRHLDMGSMPSAVARWAMGGEEPTAESSLTLCSMNERDLVQVRKVN